MASGTITNNNAVTSESLSLTGFESPLYLQRVGKICFLTYNGNVTSMAGGDISFTQTMPERFKPAYSLQIQSNRQSTVNFALSITPGGVISGYNYSGAVSQRSSCRFGTVSYIAAN